MNEKLVRSLIKIILDWEELPLEKVSQILNILISDDLDECQPVPKNQQLDVDALLAKIIRDEEHEDNQNTGKNSQMCALWNPTLAKAPQFPTKVVSSYNSLMEILNDAEYQKYLEQTNNSDDKGI